MTNGLTEPSQHVTSRKLHILQINLNKSKKAHLELINARLSKKYDIVLLQEDLLEIPTNHENEDAIGEDFEETTNRLKHMMTGPNGGLAWSKEHNSKFEVSKSAIMHFTRKTIWDPTNNTRISTPKPPLTLEGQPVKEATTYK